MLTERIRLLKSYGPFRNRKVFFLNCPSITKNMIILHKKKCIKIGWKWKSKNVEISVLDPFMSKMVIIYNFFSESDYLEQGFI